MAPNERIERLTETLVKAADPVRVILFGSQARGEAQPDSDFDVLVVEREAPNRMAEMVRLSRLIREHAVAVDLLVVSAKTFDYWKDTPGNVYHEAATHGRSLYEAA